MLKLTEKQFFDYLETSGEFPVIRILDDILDGEIFYTVKTQSGVMWVTAKGELRSFKNFDTVLKKFRSYGIYEWNIQPNELSK